MAIKYPVSDGKAGVRTSLQHCDTVNIAFIQCSRKQTIEKKSDLFVVFVLKEIHFLIGS